MRNAPELLYFALFANISLNPIAYSLMTENRKREMKQAMKLVKAAYKELFINNHSKEIRKYLFPILKTRISNPGRSSRGYFVCKVWESISGESLFNEDFNKKAISLALIAELATCITYLENQIIDGKDGVMTKQGSNNQIHHRVISQKLISSRLVKYELYAYTKRQFPGESVEIIEALEDIFTCFSFGEYLEQEQLSFDNLKEDEHQMYFEYPGIDDKIPKAEIESMFTVSQWDTDLELTPFIKTYLNRTYLINAVLYEKMVRLLIKLNGKGEDRQFLIQFAHHFGILQQLVNDILDFVPSTWMTLDKNMLEIDSRIEWVKQKGNKEEMPPSLEYVYKTRGKQMADSFADIKNDLPTLPLIVYYNNIHKQQTDSTPSSLFQHSDRINFNVHFNQVMTLIELQKYQALDQAIDLAKSWASSCRNLLNGRNYEALADMTGIANSNTYYTLLKKKNCVNIE